MKTPKDYTSNLANKIITPPMLDDCLYSVNKRAKNCRDKIRQYERLEYRDYHFLGGYPFMGDNIKKYGQMRDEYYSIKDKLLALLQPTCIHHEQYFRYFDIFDDEDLERECDAYGYPLDGEDDDDGCYELCSTTDYYYLYYELPKHSFHHPISAPADEPFESWAKKTYEGLEIVTLDDNIETYGDDTDNLISCQFVKKVIALIDSGDFTYQTATAQHISTESEYRQCA